MLRKMYIQPSIDLIQVVLEDCIVTASINTGESIPLITEEEELTDTENWTFE